MHTDYAEMDREIREEMRLISQNADDDEMRRQALVALSREKTVCRRLCGIYPEDCRSFPECYHRLSGR